MAYDKRTCGNCAWDVLMGDDEYCIKDTAGKDIVGYPAREDGKTWCNDWNHFLDTLPKEARKQWFASENARKCMDRHWEGVVGPIDALHKD